MAQEENVKIQKLRYRNKHTFHPENEQMESVVPHKLLVWVNIFFCYSEEFEATNNTVELHLHLAPSYRLENGALQPISKEQIGSTTLSFDRRKTVGDLRLSIYQVTFISKNTICCVFQTLIEISFFVHLFI